jgi:hypothetical protein
MRIVALVAGKSYLLSIACIPGAVDAAMSTCFPVTVRCTMTLSAQQDRLIAGNFTAIVVYICFQIGTIMAVETAEIQSVIKNHLPMCAERQMKCAWCFEIFIAFAR